jgi:membrane protease YdiL (CAAX protease family)
MLFEVFRVKPQIVLEAQKARFQPIFILQVLMFISIFIITQIASSIPMAIGIIIKVLSNCSNGSFDPQNPASITGGLSKLESTMALPMLFSTIIATVLVIVYCRFIEKRSLYSMGFVKNKAVKDYLLGLLIGLVMFSACVLISALTGTLTYNGVILGNGIGLLFAFFIGFIFQGMNEEVMLRGYFMISAATKAPLLVAVMANSIIFALLHILNSNIAPLALINLVLFGLFASVYTLKANSIWGICAFHSIWNFAQGNIFGIPVSGLSLNASVFSFKPTDSGTLFNGGGFGLEGGLAVTIVLVVSIIITMTVKGRTSK